MQKGVYRIPNPGAGGTIAAVTDRALRYRAAKNPPPGPRICHYCGAGESIDVEHVDGLEENTAPENLTYACRSCNTVKGLAFRDAGMGRATRQFNPPRRGAVASLAAWKNEVSSLMGLGPHKPAAAIRAVQATPHAKRTAFARQLARRREKNPGATSNHQYFTAIQIMRGVQPGDVAASRQIIDDTPAWQRSEWTRFAWRTRKEVYGPSGRSGAAVPF